MAISSVTEVIGASSKGWQDASEKALERANQTLRNIVGFEVVSEKAKVENGKIREYRVQLKITFILEDKKK
ncbi:MAG: dodecin domain-containing protein [Deltaproteobacteria bacterium]|nr:dodecin domain-containing protein [Deltaproteobacteria bacterium]